MIHSLELKYIGSQMFHTSRDCAACLPLLFPTQVKFGEATSQGNPTCAENGRNICYISGQFCHDT